MPFLNLDSTSSPHSETKIDARPRSSANLGHGTLVWRGEGALIPLIAVFGLLAIGMVLVIYGTVAENRWGINFSAVSCPCCKATLHQMRKPRSLRQALWGGYTCAACGAEVDKWGRQINRPSQ